MYELPRDTCVRIRACVFELYLHAYFYFARSGGVEGEGGHEGRRKEQETSMLGPCDRHGGGEWSWGFRLNEYTMNEREKEGNEKERERDRG